MVMIIAIFIFGLIIGSFLNALIWRLWSGKSIMAASSECPICHHELSWSDLVPVVSFFVLGRKCRYCRKPISWQYPAVELATALGFVLVARNFQFPISNFQFWMQIIFASILIVIFVYDLKHYLILDKIVFPGAVIALGYQVYRGDWVNALLGAAGLSGFFGLLYFVSRGRWSGL